MYVSIITDHACIHVCTMPATIQTTQFNSQACISLSAGYLNCLLALCVTNKKPPRLAWRQKGKQRRNKRSSPSHHHSSPQYPSYSQFSYRSPNKVPITSSLFFHISFQELQFKISPLWQHISLFSWP